MSNGVEMKVDWSKAPSGAEYARVVCGGKYVDWYCVENNNLYYYKHDGSKRLSGLYYSVNALKMCPNIVECPINYPNPLMKYIGCEVVWNFQRHPYSKVYRLSGYISHVIGKKVGVKYGRGSVLIDPDFSGEYKDIYLVNEDGSLVQLGKEDW
jgi:hypothetical protein